MDQLQGAGECAGAGGRRRRLGRRFLEAEGFAYLAMRSKKGLPLSLPTTTGVASR